MILEKADVTRLFEKGGYTINERFEECGFIYFPASEPRTKENPNQGRVLWVINKHVYPDTPDGALQKRLDQMTGLCKDELSISSSWGRANDVQIEEIRELLKYYVIFCRQQRDDYVPSISDQREPEEVV